MGRCNPKTNSCTRTPWWREAMGINWYGQGGGVQPAAMIYDGMTASSIQLYWSRVSGTTNYVLQKDGVQIYSGADTTFSVSSGISPGQSYVFRVRADNSDWTILNVTIPLFYDSGVINSTVPNVALGTRQTALEPSTATVDKPMSWHCKFRLSNLQTLENNYYILDNTIAGGTAQQYTLFVIGQSNNSDVTNMKLRFLITSDTSTTNFIYIQSTNKIIPNRTYDVCITYDGSEANTGFEMYINSVRDATATRVTGGTYTGALDNASLRFRLGSDQANRQASYNVRDVFIEDREWSQVDVDEIYNNGVPIDVTTLSFYSDIVAYWPCHTDWTCENNATFNLTGTTQSSQRTMNPTVSHMGYRRAEVGNTRYIAFGGVDKNGDTLNLRIRSGTSHLANGKIVKIPITISTEAPGAPVDVITDGSFDLRGGSNGQVGSKINFFSSRHITVGDTFEDALRYESTDGLIGETFGAGIAMTENYSRFNFYGKVINANGTYVVPFFGHDGAGTWKLSLRESIDGVNWTDRDIFDGMNQYGETAIAYTDGVWILLFRRNNTPFGIYQSYSQDERVTWSTPELTNLAGTTGAANCDITVNSVGRMHITVMDRSGVVMKRSKNNYVFDVMEDATAYNTPENLFQSYTTDSLGVLGYPNIEHLGDELYFEGFSCEQSSSRGDYYYGIGKINEPV